MSSVESFWKSRLCRILLLSAIAAINSCGLFDTRTPEEPSSGRSSFTQPIEPDLVVRNLSNSMKERNADDYVKCFADSGYKFIPSVDAAALYAGAFVDWNAASERKFMSQLIAKTTAEEPPEVTLSSKPAEQTAPDRAIYTGDYSIIIQHNLVGIPKLYSGSMRLVISKNSSSLWAVSEWTDIVTSDTSAKTWSSMKALFGG